jgi:hypothetical protein
MLIILRNKMNCNSDVTKTELQLLHTGYLVILHKSSKKIPGIQYKINYSLPTLHIDSIQNGAKVTGHWRQQVKHRLSRDCAV